MSNPASKSNQSSKESTKGAPCSAETKPVRLLSGGNPQIAKGDGDAPVQAFIAAMPGWKSAIGERLDALITLHFSDVQKAVRWNSPFYGLAGQGWLVSFHVLSRCVKLNFFCGAALVPVPPGAGKDPNARWLNITETEPLDDAQFVAWLKQAAKLRGWITSST
jgi:hypothetical protein